MVPGRDRQSIMADKCAIWVSHLTPGDLESDFIISQKAKLKYIFFTLEYSLLVSTLFTKYNDIFSQKRKISLHANLLFGLFYGNFLKWIMIILTCNIQIDTDEILRHNGINFSNKYTFKIYCDIYVYYWHSIYESFLLLIEPILNWKKFCHMPVFQTTWWYN